MDTRENIDPYTAVAHRKLRTEDAEPSTEFDSSRSSSALLNHKRLITNDCQLNTLNYLNGVTPGTAILTSGAGPHA
jgi:hypothetical protein